MVVPKVGEGIAGKGPLTGLAVLTVFTSSQCSNQKIKSKKLVELKKLDVFYILIVLSETKNKTIKNNNTYMDRIISFFFQFFC